MSTRARHHIGTAALVGVALFGLTALAPSGPAAAAARFDTSQPFEINADALEVQRNKNRAIFVGNVAARQGDLLLRADRLSVDYGKGSKVMEGTPEISQLEARGAVHLVSPTETVHGDWAVYDVPSRIITVGGDVVLTRGENILQGQKLTFNLLTGESRLESATPTASKTPQGRVRAVFNPSAAKTK